MNVAAVVAASALTQSPSLTGVVLILGVVGLVVDRVADARGWSRSSKVLRRENVDLVRRNTELDETVMRHEATITAQGLEIATLTTRVAVLSERDQAAVLEQLKSHERLAEGRSDTTNGLLTEIRDALAVRP